METTRSPPLNEVQKQQIIDFYMTKLGVPYRTQLTEFNEQGELNFTPSYYQFISTIRGWQNSDGFAAWLFGSFFYLHQQMIDTEPKEAYKATVRLLEKFITRNHKHEMSGTVEHTPSKEFVGLLREVLAQKRVDSE